MLSPLEQEELLEALADDFDWSLWLPLIIRKRLNQDVGIIPADVMEEDMRFGISFALKSVLGRFYWARRNTCFSINHSFWT